MVEGTLIETALLVAMVFAMIAAIISGMPAMVAIAGAPVLAALAGSLLSVFDMAFLAALPQRAYGVMGNSLLAAIPLFIAMGLIIERSGMARDLIELVARNQSGDSGQPKRLAVGVILVAVMLGASTGVIGATVVMLAVTAYPGLMRAGFPQKSASGLVLASGTLGQIIPPSIVLIILADQVSNAWQATRRNAGDFTVEPVTVGDVFAAALIPGLVLALLYAVFVLFSETKGSASMEAKLISPLGQSGEIQAAAPVRAWVALLPLALITAVLGSILFGFATPTEAAAVGAGAALLIACLRSKNRLSRAVGAIGLSSLIMLIFMPVFPSTFSAFLGPLFATVAALCLVFAIFAVSRAGSAAGVVSETVILTGMIFGIVIAASFFALVFRGLGGEALLQAVAEALPGGAMSALVAVMVVVFVLGFFLEFIEITLLIVPICAPVLFALGVDPLWFAILFALNLQTSFLTPPFGVSLFYFRSAIGDQIETRALYSAVVPFVILQLCALVLVLVFPQLALALPAWLAN